MSKTTFSFAKQSPFFRQRGASLLEAISFLGIAALVILGAVSLLSSAYGSGQTNKTMDELVGIRTATNRLYMGQAAAYGTGSLNDQLIKAKAIPTTIAVSGTDLFNTWNGAVAIDGNNSSFTISYALVPQDVCINLLTASVGWTSVKVGAAAARTAFPISPANATTDCAAATNTIVWTAA